MDMVVSNDKILEAAHAFGLKGDTLGKLSRQDRFGKLVDFTVGSVGFVTKAVLSPNVLANSFSLYELKRSYVSLGESKIVAHDSSSDIVMDPRDWQRIMPASRLIDIGGRLMPAWTDPNIVESQNFFFANDATFVATELCGIPERLTLHRAEPRFDIDYIIERLKKYRADHPLPSIRDLMQKYQRVA